jgi:hypothetical protein
LKVSQGKPARNWRACGESGRSAVGSRSALLIHCTVLTPVRSLNDLRHSLEQKNSELNLHYVK